MALGNGELADTDQAVHLAGVLVAEQGRRLTQAHGQVTVAAAAVQIDLILEGAGHGTQRKALLGVVIRITDDEHAVQIMVPVTGDLEKLALGHQRRLGQQVAGLLLSVLHPTLQQLHHAGSLGQQDGQALANGIYGGKILQFAAQFIVVALQRLFALLQIGFQLILAGEGHAVDALQRLAIAVAAPVGGVAGGQFNAAALDTAGGIHMGAGAQIHELALLIEGDVGIGGQIIDQFHLIRLLPLLHVLEGLGTGQLKALQLQLFLADLAHLRLNLCQVILGKSKGRVQIVVKAVVDARADGQLHLRMQALHRLSQNVGAGVPVRLAVLLVLKRKFLADFAHVMFLLVMCPVSAEPLFGAGQIKIPTPEWHQG